MWLLILNPLFYILILFFSITLSVSCKEAFVRAWSAASWQGDFGAADLLVLVAWLKTSFFIWVGPEGNKQTNKQTNFGSKSIFK